MHEPVNRITHFMSEFCHAVTQFPFVPQNCTSLYMHIDAPT